MSKQQIQLANVNDLKLVLAGSYQKQIQNYFGDEKKALKFLSGVVSAVQANPKLLECEPTSLINSFMTMAQLELMPSNVSGEAYVLPYNNKGGMVAQFQLGYQGLVTLFYRAGATEIIAEIVREKDNFSYVNGKIEHGVDPFADDRGKAIGAYVIVKLQTGGSVHKVMKKDDIMAMGKKFSKSFSSSFSPWNEKNDPELWMWKKTVLKQVAKLVPKNETIYRAVAADNKADGKIKKPKEVESRFDKVKDDVKKMSMGNQIKNKKDEQEKEKITKEKKATRKAKTTAQKQEIDEDIPVIQIDEQ